jgi:hypothetical protein
MRLIKQSLLKNNPHMYRLIVKLKNRIKANYKRCIYVLILIYLKVFKPIGSIAIIPGKDGGGSQLLRTLSLALLCNNYNIEYKISKINTIDYPPVNISLEDWIYHWNNIINFDEVYAENISGFVSHKLFHTLLLLPWKKVTFGLEDGMEFANLYPDLYPKFIKNLGLKIDNTNVSRIDQKAIIHVRKPIVRSEHPDYVRDSAREIGINRLITTVSILKSRHNLKNSEIKVFTTRIDDQLSMLCEYFPGIFLDSETDAISAIIEMSLADILVVAQSAMSYIPALFNLNGSIYYYKSNWRHTGLSQWKGIEDIEKSHYLHYNK